MTDIILVTHNRLEFTKKCILALFEHTSGEFNLIIIDNASTDGTQEYLLGLKKMISVKQIICNTQNLGLEMALNQGLKHVETKRFVTMDNDIIVSAGWLQKLTHIMCACPEFEAVACRPQVLIGVGPIFKDAGAVVETPCVGSHARMMYASSVRRAGGWQEVKRNDGRGNEDQDICGKLKRYGKVGYARDVWCYHQFGEDEKWGYDGQKEYRMGRSLEKSPKDIKFDPITCEPEVRGNE